MRATSTDLILILTADAAVRLEVGGKEAMMMMIQEEAVARAVSMMLMMTTPDPAAGRAVSTVLMMWST